MPYDLFMQSVDGGSPWDVTASIDRPVLGVKWQNKATAAFSVGDGFRYRLYRLNEKSNPLRSTCLTRTATSRLPATDLLLSSRSGSIASRAVVQPADRPAKQVSHVQQGWDGIVLADAELFRFKSFDGTEIEAALMKPANPKLGTKLPLILYVHGGPAGSFSATYSPWPQLLVAHGYEVLMVNPRGSATYGEKFLKANRADWGGADFKDLMAGVDTVLARGETDPNRLGIGGWSYGGYMAEWAITQTNRFKAAVSGAGMFDLAAEFGTEKSRPTTNGTSARLGSIPSGLHIVHRTCTFGTRRRRR